MTQFDPHLVIYQALCDSSDFARKSDVLTKSEADEEYWFQALHILDRLRAEGYVITTKKGYGSRTGRT